MLVSSSCENLHTLISSTSMDQRLRKRDMQNQKEIFVSVSLAAVLQGANGKKNHVWHFEHLKYLQL